MKAVITVELLPLKSHQRTGGPDRPWLAESVMTGMTDGAEREGTCRGVTFAATLRTCVQGVIGQSRGAYSGSHVDR